MPSIITPKEIDVVILCGGMGKRLRDIINDRPKPMAEINGRPFLDILIDYLVSYGFKRFILCIGYMGDKIKQYYQRRASSLTILFSEEREPLGTGGAIKNAESLIQSNPFMVMNGDSFCQVDLGKFINFHISKGASLSIVLANLMMIKDGGVITLGDSQRIIGFDEKVRAEDNSLINAGIYLLETDVLSMIPAHKNYSLEYDLFPRMINKEFYGYINHEILRDIGTPEGYKKANEFFGKHKGLWVRK